MNVILNVVLFRLTGITGPALATVLSGLTMQMLQLAFSSSITGVSFRKIFPWKEILLLTLLNCVLALVFGLVHRNLLPGLWTAVALAAGWGIVYLYVIKKKISLWWLRLNQY